MQNFASIFVETVKKKCAKLTIITDKTKPALI